MEIKAEELLYKLQQGQELPGNSQLVVVFGEEDYYRQQIVQALPEVLFKGVDSADREVQVFEKDTDLHQLSAAINTYPFFCGQSLVVLQDEKLLAAKAESDNRKQQLDKLADILSDLPDYCTVLVNASKLDKRTKLFKALKKQGLMCECNSIKLNNLSPWLEEQAWEHGAKWQFEAVGRIMEYLQPVDKVPLKLLQQEIAKLAVYAGARKLWTAEDVDTIFAALPEASSFAIINAMGKRNLAEVLGLLAAEKKKGTNVLPLCALITFKLRQMLQYLELSGRGFDYKGILAEMKLNPYVAKNLQREARGFTTKSLTHALLDLAQLNIDLRKGGRDYARLEEILLTLLS